MFQGFQGEFEYRIDEKGRIPLPRPFRHALEAGLVLTRGPDACIVAYPVAEWDKIAASLNSNGSLIPSKMRRLKRGLFATAFTTQLDGQNRVTLNPALRKFAGIEADVIIAGCANYFEIWSRERWDAEIATSQQQAWQIIESMESHP